MNGFSAEGQPTFGPLFESRYASLRLCDIGTNILDKSFTGKYNSGRSRKSWHANDINEVIARARTMGVCSLFFTGSNLEDSTRTLNLVNAHELKEGIFCTAGVHPTASTVFKTRGTAQVINDLKCIIDQGLPSGKLVAFGECGLDYDRLQRCDKETQLIGFRAQLELASNYDLPLFLHSRNTRGDFQRLLAEYQPRLRGGGVVHSYTGHMDEMQALIDLGYYIGVNGCSLRTEEGLANVAAIPDHLLLLETDAPWCGIKPSHPSFKHVTTHFPSKHHEKYQSGMMVKDRNEPCTMIQVLEVVAKIRNVDPFDLAEQVYANTEALFSLMKK